MSKSLWLDPISRAFFDAWIDEIDLPDEITEQKIEAFSKRWGRLDLDAFKRALQEGDVADRLCAIFVLGYFAPTDVGGLLMPFLYSSVRKERWASAIALSEDKDERAFPFLQEFLLEQMEYFPTYGEKDLNKAFSNAVIVAKERFDNPNWHEVADPTIIKAWDEMQTYGAEYWWYTLHRINITKLLGAWGDSRAIPVLRQALQRCWEIDQLPHFKSGIPGSFFAKTWYHLQDELAYALGQLKAWKALDGLELPQMRFQLARMYLVFGSLKLDLHLLYNGDIMKLINTEDIDLDSIVNVLREHFGLSEFVSKGTLQRFQQWYRERTGT
ncbi:MAG TPA: hypothetical protein VN729_12870 [Ktedonobacteraceae bacterium]|nr:hypothetical protein [Ktedonobacteraceae bacterium]